MRKSSQNCFVFDVVAKISKQKSGVCGDLTLFTFRERKKNAIFEFPLKWFFIGKIMGNKVIISLQQTKRIKKDY